MENPISSDSLPNNSDIKALLEENNRLLKELKSGNDRLERYLRWSRVWSVLRLLIILIPLIVGIIFLRPYFKNAADTYQELLGVPGVGGINQPLDILEELKKYQQVEIK